MLPYPIAGSWKWGGGWLDQLGFYDFAGSTLSGVGDGLSISGSLRAWSSNRKVYQERCSL